MGVPKDWWKKASIGGPKPDGGGNGGYVPGKVQGPVWTGHGYPATPSNNNQYGVPFNQVYSPGQQFSAADIKWAQDQANAQIPSVHDPYGGQNPLDLLNYAYNAGKSKGGSGGGGGSSGGGTGKPSAATVAAYQQMLASLNAQGGVDNASLDKRKHDLQAMYNQSNVRLGGILHDLQAGANVSKKAVDTAYTGAQKQEQLLHDQYAAEEAARAQGGSHLLAAFGANPADVSRQYGALDSIAAQRGALVGQQGAADAFAAGRGGVYNALMGDTKTQNGQLYDQLIAQVSAQRTKAEQDAAAQRAQLAIEAAKYGVTLPTGVKPVAKAPAKVAAKGKK